MALALANRLALRPVILADGIGSAANAALFIFAAAALGRWFGLPADLLFWIGIAFVPWAAALLIVAREQPVNTGAARAIAAGNGIWALASLAVVAAGLFDLTPLGYVFVIGQALLVGLIAEIQWMGARRPA